MKELIKDVSKNIKTYSSNNIEITAYCRGRMEKRGVEETLLLSTLFSTDYIYFVKEQEIPFHGKIEKRHKLIYKLSSKHSLIIIYREKRLSARNHPPARKEDGAEDKKYGRAYR